MRLMLRRLAALTAVLWLCASLPALAQENASFYVSGEASLSATTSSNRAALVAGAPVALVKNTGASGAYVTFGDVTVLATTGGHLIAAGETQALNPAGTAYIAAITGSGSTTLRITSGYGTPIIVGAAGIASGLALDASVGTTNTDLGPPGATACATDTGPCSGNALWQRIAQRLTSILTAIGTPLQAGGNVAITSLPALPAGANLIGATSIADRQDATPTVQNASYVSGNDIGGLVAFTLDHTGSGLLQSVGVQFIGGATTQINAACFDSNPTGSTFTDKGTFSIAAADEAKRINKTLLALTPAALTGDAVTAASVDNYAQPFKSTGTIWCAYVATGIFTPASTTDLRINIKYIQSAK